MPNKHRRQGDGDARLHHLGQLVDDIIGKARRAIAGDIAAPIMADRLRVDGGELVQTVDAVIGGAVGRRNPLIQRIRARQRRHLAGGRPGEGVVISALSPSFSPSFPCLHTRPAAHRRPEN